MSERAKQIKIVKKQFDAIYKTCEDLSNEYSKGLSIPLVTLKEVLMKAKIKRPAKSIKAFAIEYNKCLDVLESSCVKVAKPLDNKVPLKVLKKYIGVLKDNL
ncbi:MAG: hypothetical protein GY793_01855 [Proteobacteria bacterium]|nr:hypothetical protein [Pseudomonadota bacterium]